MTPVDGITAPKKNNKKRPVKKRVAKKPTVKKNKNKQNPPDQNNKNINAQILNNDNNKHRLVWIVSIIIVFIIFIAWSSLIFQGKIIQNNPATENEPFLENLSNDLTKIWDSFKTDYLKIKNSAEEELTEEERIKKLEESVFPNFNEYK